MDSSLFKPSSQKTTDEYEKYFSSFFKENPKLLLNFLARNNILIDENFDVTIHFNQDLSCTKDIVRQIDCLIHLVDKRDPKLFYIYIVDFKNKKIGYDDISHCLIMDSLGCVVKTIFITCRKTTENIHPWISSLRGFKDKIHVLFLHDGMFKIIENSTALFQKEVYLESDHEEQFSLALDYFNGRGDLTDVIDYCPGELVQYDVHEFKGKEVVFTFVINESTMEIAEVICFRDSSNKKYNLIENESSFYFEIQCDHRFSFREINVFIEGKKTHTYPESCWVLAEIPNKGPEGPSK